MKNLVTMGCVLSVLLIAAPSRAQRLEVDMLENPASHMDGGFADHFGVTNQVYSRRVFRARAAGWPLLVLGTGSVFGAVMSQTVTDGFAVPILVGVTGAVLIAASGILLIRARIEVGRRRRWRRAQHTRPTVEARFTGLGTSLRISW